MWSFYLNGTKYPVRDVKLESKNNDFDFFSGRLRIPSDSVKDSIGKGGHLYPDHWVKITDYDDSIIFEGFLENVEEDGLDLILEGRDFKVLLLDESLPRNSNFTNLTGSVTLQTILSYSSKVSSVAIGSYPETIAGTLRFDNENLLRAIASTCNIYGYDFWVTYDGSNFRLNIGERGTVTSNIYYAGWDLKVTKTSTKARDIINRQMVFGAGDGVNQIRCCVPFVDHSEADSDRCAGFGGYNANCLHSDASASQISVGIMEGKPHVDTSIKSLDVAIATAKTILDYSLGIQLEVEFAKYVAGLQIGDTIRIIDSKKNVDETQRVKNITRKLDKRKMEVSFYSRDDEFESLLAKITRNSDLNDVQGLGATNIFQVQSYENCDSSHPLHIRFYLHPDIIFLDKIEINFNIKPYRAYHTSLTSEQSHTHKTRIGLHDFDSAEISGQIIYILGAIDGGVGNELFAWDEGGIGYNESSDSIENSGHTHPISFGISEPVTLSAPSVSITVNGSSLGAYTEDQSELSISDLIGSNRGWIDIEFAPTQPLRIEANVYCMVYIESEV